MYIRWIALFLVLVTPALADDYIGLGSQRTGKILQSGPTAPVGTDLVQGFQGQNGDAVFSYRSVLPAYTIALLPICTSYTGMLAYVTNGVATPSYRDSVSTTGSTVQLVFCDGSGWTYR